MSKGKGAVERAMESASEIASPPAYDTSSHHHSESEPPPSQYSIFPRDTVIYRTKYISFILGPQYEANKPQPPPLFYVSVHMDNRFTNKSEIPQIRLHYGPDDTYPVIVRVRFRVTTTSDITIWHDPKSTGNETSKYNAIDNKSSETNISMTKTGAMTSDVHTFYHTIAIRDGTLVWEKFEWRHSGEPEVEALATENHPGENITQEKRGLKLVRVSTGKTLAAFAGGKHQRNYNPKRVAGKLRFVGSQVLDPLVVVMSILSIIERSRQNAVWDAQGVGICVVV
jgi:hypothetical protein